jgi:hypothetical protein
VRIPEQACRDTSGRTCVLAYGVIYGSRRPFWCVRAWNVDAIFFMLGWDQCRFNKKHVETRYAKLVVLHLSGSAGHEVPSGASGRETSMHYFLFLGMPREDPTKTTMGHIMPKLCVLLLVRSMGHIVNSGASRA